MDNIPILHGDKTVGYIILSDEMQDLISGRPKVWCVETTDGVATPVYKVVADEVEAGVFDEPFAVYKSATHTVSKLDEAREKGIPIYGVGHLDEGGGYGMTDGPTPNLNDMLKSYGYENARILQLSGDINGDIVLYEWSVVDEAWKVYTPDATEMIQVRLTYFKRTGKYYSSGEYDSPMKPLHEIWDDVRNMMAEGKWPGLIEGDHDFIVYVDAPRHPHAHPRLIIPVRKAD
jgi:hypothetical protein